MLLVLLALMMIWCGNNSSDCSDGYNDNSKDNSNYNGSGNSNSDNSIVNNDRSKLLSHDVLLFIL